MLRSLLSLVSLSTLATALAVHRVKCPDGVNSASNAACCAFFSLRDDLLTNHFNAGCSEEVHEALRLGFHDAISFSSSQTAKGIFSGTGADGSVLLFPDVEANFPANNGISAPIEDLLPFLAKHNVTAADMVQFAAAVGVTQCPGAPQLQFLAGRKNAAKPPPDGLVPLPTDSVTTILKRFDDAGRFTADEVVGLLASHSIARSDHIDPNASAVPFDTTPFTFDTQFFLETLLVGTGFPGSGKPQDGEVESPLPQGNGDDVGEMRLESDFNFARDPRTACTWQGFINQQTLMMNKFRAAMEKLAIVGQNRAHMVDCSEVLPPPTPPVKKPATFPATKTKADVQQACKQLRFPTLSTDPGAATVIPHCPDGSDDCDAPDS